MIPAEAVHAATDAMQQFALIEDRDGLQAWEAYAKIALEAAAPYMLTEATPKPPKHQCEPWQIQVNGSGTFRYCAACGKPAP